jgi:MFS family permease
VSGAGLALAAVGLALMSTWGRGSLDQASSTAVLALTGLGIGLALAPVNDAALAEAARETHGTASALVVVARMVGMVVGVALLTAIGLHQYYGAVARLPDPTDADALRGAAVLQVAWVFRGAAVAAGLGAIASLALGVHRREGEHATTFGL